MLANDDEWRRGWLARQIPLLLSDGPLPAEKVIEKLEEIARRERLRPLSEAHSTVFADSEVQASLSTLVEEGTIEIWPYRVPWSGDADQVSVQLYRRVGPPAAG